MATANLYEQAIFCLHGLTGEIAADAGAADTTFTVQAAVLADVTIVVGSIIVLDDGASSSAPMSILSIDFGANTFSTDVGPGSAFLAAAPTSVVRVPHWARLWTGSSADLTECPELASHPIQAGSAKTLDESDNGAWAVSDVKPTGVVGGGYAPRKVWTRRDLNTITGNIGLAVQLAAAPAGANQILVAIGSYWVSASAPAIRMGHHKIRFRNVTDGADALVGTSERSDNTRYKKNKKGSSSDGSSGSGSGSSIPTGGRSFAEGVVVVTGAPKVFELQHYGTASRSTYGFGDSVGALGVPEVYAVLTLVRIV